MQGTRGSGSCLLCKWPPRARLILSC